MPEVRTGEIETSDILVFERQTVEIDPTKV
jgi:hypothetical protein